MSELALTITKAEEGRWLFTWDVESESAFNIYHEGILLANVTVGEYLSELPDYVDSPPVLEIVDSSDVAENVTYPPFVRLQWRRVAGETGYRIQEKVGMSWVTRREIMDGGAEYYAFQSRALPDGSVSQWRVAAFGQQGDAGSYVSFSLEIVRNPEEPDVDMLYEDSTGLLVISGESS